MSSRRSRTTPAGARWSEFVPEMWQFFNNCGAELVRFVANMPTGLGRIAEHASADIDVLRNYLLGIILVA